MSEAAKNRFTNEVNPFKGKHHTDEVKNFISKNNSKIVKVYDINQQYILTLNSIKEAVNYIKINNLSELGSGLYKKIKIASETKKPLYGLYFEIIDNGHKQQVFSEQGLKNIRNHCKELNGYTVATNTGLEFSSLADASKYILSLGLDKVHYRTVGNKIKTASNTNTELYGYKWKITKM